jgi:hypothetical protein
MSHFLIPSPDGVASTDDQSHTNNDKNNNNDNNNNNDKNNNNNNNASTTARGNFRAATFNKANQDDASANNNKIQQNVGADDDDDDDDDNDQLQHINTPDATDAASKIGDITPKKERTPTKKKTAAEANTCSIDAVDFAQSAVTFAANSLVSLQAQLADCKRKLADMTKKYQDTVMTEAKTRADLTQFQLEQRQANDTEVEGAEKKAFLKTKPKEWSAAQHAFALRCYNIYCNEQVHAHGHRLFYPPSPSKVAALGDEYMLEPVWLVFPHLCRRLKDTMKCQKKGCRFPVSNRSMEQTVYSVWLGDRRAWIITRDYDCSADHDKTNGIDIFERYLPDFLPFRSTHAHAEVSSGSFYFEKSLVQTLFTFYTTTNGSVQGALDMMKATYQASALSRYRQYIDSIDPQALTRHLPGVIMPFIDPVVPGVKTIQRLLKDVATSIKKMQDATMTHKATFAKTISCDHVFSANRRTKLAVNAQDDSTFASACFTVVSDTNYIVGCVYANAESYQLLVNYFNAFKRIRTTQDGHEDELRVIWVDKCCSHGGFRDSLRSIFSDRVLVKLDFFHAVRRLYRHTLRTDKRSTTFVKEFVEAHWHTPHDVIPAAAAAAAAATDDNDDDFEDDDDTFNRSLLTQRAGKNQLRTIPPPAMLEPKLSQLLNSEKWKAHLESEPWKNLTEQVRLHMGHAVRGCLSDPPTDFVNAQFTRNGKTLQVRGSVKNEVVHRIFKATCGHKYSGGGVELVVLAQRAISYEYNSERHVHDYYEEHPDAAKFFFVAQTMMATAYYLKSRVPLLNERVSNPFLQLMPMNNEHYPLFADYVPNLCDSTTPQLAQELVKRALKQEASVDKKRRGLNLVDGADGAASLVIDSQQRRQLQIRPAPPPPPPLPVHGGGDDDDAAANNNNIARKDLTHALLDSWNYLGCSSKHHNRSAREVRPLFQQSIANVITASAINLELQQTATVFCQDSICFLFPQIQDAAVLWSQSRDAELRQKLINAVLWAWVKLTRAPLAVVQADAAGKLFVQIITGFSIQLNDNADYGDAGIFNFEPDSVTILRVDPCAGWSFVRFGVLGALPPPAPPKQKRLPGVGVDNANCDDDNGGGDGCCRDDDDDDDDDADDDARRRRPTRGSERDMPEALRFARNGQRPAALTAQSDGTRRSKSLKWDDAMEKQLRELLEVEGGGKSPSWEVITPKFSAWYKQQPGKHQFEDNSFEMWKSRLTSKHQVLQRKAKEKAPAAAAAAAAAAPDVVPTGLVEAFVNNPAVVAKFRQLLLGLDSAPAPAAAADNGEEKKTKKPTAKSDEKKSSKKNKAKATTSPAAKKKIARSK